MARIAAAAQVPTVPVGLIGTAQVWPRHSRPAPRRPAAGVLRAHFGSVVPPPTPDARSRRAFTQQVHAAVAGLCQQPVNDRFAPVTR
jgi:1-acyl-sn-glycerol-3-phosphate acyltransferase